jgi:hypothetical protein
METRSHVAERMERFPFPSVSDVLEQLGPPPAYARRFLRGGKRADKTHGTSALQGLARLARRGWPTFPVLLLVVGGYTISLLALAIALVKVISPDEVGVWVHTVGGEQRLLHAGFNAGYGGQEILGYRLAFAAFAIAAVLWILLTAVLKWLARAELHPQTNADHDA